LSKHDRVQTGPAPKSGSKQKVKKKHFGVFNTQFLNKNTGMMKTNIKIPDF